MKTSAVFATKRHERTKCDRGLLL